VINLDSLNACFEFSHLKAGDLIVIQRKQDKRRFIVKIKSLANSNDLREIVFSGRNDYFNFDMYLNGESWVHRVWHLGFIEMSSITNNMNEFPR